jgi:hypothetical protein
MNNFAAYIQGVETPRYVALRAVEVNGQRPRREDIYVLLNGDTLFHRTFSSFSL